MHYRCKNCGGNVVYSPKAGKLVCPHCDGTDSGEPVTEKESGVCPVCGAPVEPGSYNSALQCGNCSTWLILDERVGGQYLPQRIIPFRLSREDARAQIQKEFGGRPFIPGGFTANKTLMGIEGIYVPFWLYDYDSVETFRGTGQTVRRWTSGDIRYTETSYYEIFREVAVDFDNIPTDASDRMDDELMDLIEPFHYDELRDFSPEYMSGFNGEVYNRPSSEYVIRSRTKADKAIREIVDDTINGYGVVTPVSQNIEAKQVKTQYVLFPVYRYTYRYMGKDYDVFVNGQTGKMAGEAPTSLGRALGLSLATFGTGFLFMLFAGSILQML